MLKQEGKLEKELRESARFIREALIEKPSYIELGASDEEGEPLRIDKNIDETSFVQFNEEEVLTDEKAPKIAAIDGGSATIVDGHSFTIDVFRYGYLIFKNNVVIDEYIEPLSIETASVGNIKDIYSSKYAAQAGTQPDELPHFDRVVDRLRTLNEWSLAEKLISDLDRGDIVLVDGSLRSSLSVPYIMLERISKAAADKGVHLVGISKASSLYWGERSPLVPVIHRMGDKACTDKTWFCLVSDLKDKSQADIRWFGTIYVAKLSPKADFAFRVDINRFDKTNAESIMAILSAVSHDPAYMGYPYPLAAIHNRVRIEPSMIEDLYYRLQSLALQEGVEMRDWETLFADFHELLDVSD